jgi:DNA-directed RNA polymerase
LFLAYCFEYKAYTENKSTFLSHLPVQIDCTCSGLQHLAALLRDTKLAKRVNLSLVKTETSTPKDLYSSAAKGIQKLIAQSKTASDALKQIEITRGMVKRIIMTIPYNVTQYGVLEYLGEDCSYDYENKTYL